MRRNVIAAIAVAVLILGLVGGVYLSRKSYVPVLSELSTQIEQKNEEIRKLREQEKMMQKEEMPTVYVITKGKVYPVGSDSAVLQEVELKTGEVLRVNGILVRNDGTIVRLLTGDVVSTDGTIKLSTESAK